MSKPKMMHTINVPDCTFALFVTHDGEDIHLNYGDFATEDILDTREHSIISDIGASLLVVIKDIIYNAKTDIGMSTINKVDTENFEYKDNVVYLQPKKPNKH